MARTIYTPDPARIGALKDRDGVELFRDLLWCDAARLNLRNIVISLDTNTPDGGIDAKADWQEFPDAPFVSGSFHFQIKTGKVHKPWQESHVKRELFGSSKAIPSRCKLGRAVRECLDSGGQYILVALGHDLSATNHTVSEKLLRKCFQACGYQNTMVAVWGQGQIVKMLEHYPSLCLDLSGRGAAAFQTLRSWASNSDMTPTLALGEPQREFANQIRELMRGDAIQHARVVGEPGIGKTRLVLEALRSEEDLAARCLYVPQAAEFQGSELFNELMKVDREYWALLVIDECDENNRASIWHSLKGRERLKLITIDHGPEKSADDAMRVMQFPPLEQAQIESILSDYVGSSRDLFNWATWCGGSARVAHAVGENLKRNPDDLLKSPATVPIWDRFILGYKNRDSAGAERLRVVMRHIALFHKFGFKKPVAEEGAFVATMAIKVDPSITPGRFASDVEGYVERRVLQGSHTLRIVPKALHVHLWREWWEHYGGAVDLISMLDGMPSALQKWFLDMFIYANGVPSAQHAARAILSIEDGPFTDKQFLKSESGTRFINTLAEADPEATLALLQATLGRWPAVEVDEWQTGRQNIVFALEKMAAWSEYFPAAGRLLGRMALGERSTNSNNAKGTLRVLFDLRYGPTQATPSTRFALIKAWLRSADARERKLGLEMCAECLNLYGTTRIVGVEYQGMKPAIDFWRPLIWEDLFGPWREALGLLSEQNKMGDEDWKRASSREIIQRAEAMLSFNCLPEEALDALFALAADPANDLEKLTQTVILKQRHHAPELPKKALARLGALENLLSEGTFLTRFRRFVEFEIYDEDHDYGANGQLTPSSVPDERMATLARELIAIPCLMEAHFSFLLRSEGYRISKFGRQFALAARSDQYDRKVIALTDALGESAKGGFLSGYLDGAREIDASRWEKLALELLSTTDNAQSRSLAVISSGFSPSIVSRLIALYRDGSIDSSRLRSIGWGIGKRDINDEDAASILEALLARPDEQSHCIAVEIANGRFCVEATEGNDPEDLLWRVLVERDNFASKLNTMAEHHWTTFANRFLRRFPKRSLRLLSAIVMGSANTPRMRSPSSVSEVAAGICKADPKGAWKIVAKALVKAGAKGWSLRHWLGDTGIASAPVQPVIECFETDDVLRWINADPKSRLAWALEFAPKTLAAGNPGDLPRAIIEQYGSDERARAFLMGHFDTGAHWGPRSEHLSRRRDEARAWLSANPSVVVQSWIDDYIRQLTKSIEMAQIGEERMF